MNHPCTSSYTNTFTAMIPAAAALCAIREAKVSDVKAASCVSFINANQAHADCCTVTYYHAILHSAYKALCCSRSAAASPPLCCSISSSVCQLLPRADEKESGIKGFPDFLTHAPWESPPF